MPNKVMRRDEMAMPTAVRGEEVARKLERLKGKSNQGLVPDHSRGPSSPLGQRSHSKAEAAKKRREP